MSLIFNTYLHRIRSSHFCEEGLFSAKTPGRPPYTYIHFQFLPFERMIQICSFSLEIHNIILITKPRSRNIFNLDMKFELLLLSILLVFFLEPDDLLQNICISTTFYFFCIFFFLWCPVEMFVLLLSVPYQSFFEPNSALPGKTYAYQGL